MSNLYFFPDLLIDRLSNEVYMNELITVIIPVYKTERYLSRCVDSVRNQTYQNLDIVLVDDGSPDNSGVLCDQFALEDNRIRVIHKKNGGLSDARNAGIDVAKGKYLCFCDSDDWIESEIIECAVKEIRESEVDLLIWSYSFDRVDEHETLISAGLCMANGVISYNQTDLFRQNSTQGLLGFAWNKLYKTDAIQKAGVRFKKGVSLVEDVLFNSDIICKADSIRLIDTIGTHYMQRGRMTLGNAYYENYSALIYKATKAKKRMMRHFGCLSSDITSSISDYIMKAFKTGTVSIACNSQLTETEKITRMRLFLKDSDTCKLLKQVRAKNGKELLFLFLIRLRASYVLIKVAK